MALSQQTQEAVDAAHKRLAALSPERNQRVADFARQMMDGMDLPHQREQLEKLAAWFEERSREVERERAHPPAT